MENNAWRNAKRNAKLMLNAMHVRTQRTQLTNAVKTQKKIVKLLTVRVGLLVTQFQVEETAVA